MNKPTMALVMAACLLGTKSVPAQLHLAPPAPTAEVTAAQQLLTPEQIAKAQFDLGAQFLQDRKYLGAAGAFEHAVAAAPRFFEAYNNWGIALVQLGKESNNPEQRLKRFQEAAEKFGKAAEIRPTDKTVYVLWSETLVLLGDLPLEPQMRLACYMGAVEKCRQAVAIAPDDWDIYNKWGVILTTKLADFAQDAAAKVQVYHESAGLFEKAAQRARFSGEVGPMYANWGGALVQQARLTADGTERQDVLRQALEKFDRSARVLPGAASTYAMWGSALIDLGRASRMRNDVRAAVEKLNASLALRPDDAGVYYNLACAYTLLDNPVLAMQNLKKCLDLDRSNTYLGAANRDADLQPLRKYPGFNELLGGTGTGLAPSEPTVSDRPH